MGRSPVVLVLKPGLLKRDEDGEILDARSTVTLIVSGSRKILVDTGLAGEEKIILDGLLRLGLRPEKIDLVINTHMHPDHCGNNHLFTEAENLSCENYVGYVSPAVRILKTPGHTTDSISVLSFSERRIVMAGDALPTMNNYLKWVPPRIHVDYEKAMSSLSIIVRMADIVVPGHDSPFLVKEKRYTNLLDSALSDIRF
jgi:glyoxylase-like metal-dependent hydrolase (beta-lactamase superfamily II)